jgi:hypothetical protein
MKNSAPGVYAKHSQTTELCIPYVLGMVTEGEIKYE